MGFMDVEVKTSFDKMFDLNKDGFLDPVEQGLMNSYINRLACEMADDDDETEELRMDRDFMAKLVS